MLDKTTTLVIKKVVLRAEPLLLETFTSVQLNLDKLISNNLSFEFFKEISGFSVEIQHLSMSLYMTWKVKEKYEQIGQQRSF